MRGVPRSGLWSEGEIASSGIGSERSKVASVAEGKPPASQGPRPQVNIAGGDSVDSMAAHRIGPRMMSP